MGDCNDQPVIRKTWYGIGVLEKIKPEHSNGESVTAVNEIENLLLERKVAIVFNIFLACRKNGVFGNEFEM